jgi:hypothetical protein
LGGAVPLWAEKVPKIDTIKQSLGFIGEVSGPRLPKAGKGWVWLRLRLLLT